MIKDGIELYISDDIFQGEEIPFYLLWNEENIERFEIFFDGFCEITELHNVSDEIENNKVIKREDIKTKGYLGGMVRADTFVDPLHEGHFKVFCHLDNGRKLILEEKRLLHRTKIEMESLPSIIKYPFTDESVNVVLRGSTTVFIDVESTDDSEVEITLPIEIRDSLEQFGHTFIEGLKDILDEFPENKEFIEFIINIEEMENPSEQNLIEILSDHIDEVNLSEDFLESIALVFFNSIMSHSSLRDLFYRPLIEYFEQSIAHNAFFTSPFLKVIIPEGGGKFKFKIKYTDLLENECETEIFETNILSDEEATFSIKDLITMRREE